ncbi:hypothetical protein LUW74_42875 [Actinomadura madurae]|nr:hypothetical protein [Actinomadura madurae]MCQ0018745.1 hypothetical protein [Actinomadura madurae]URN09439.1 hypothetical protein LUW74_42875 [Actinomadura madurae]
MVDDDHVVDGLRGLREQVARQQHRAAVRHPVPQHRPQPADSLRIQPVGRLVQHQYVRIAQQCGRQPEPLPHSEREGADPAARHVRQLDQVQDLLDPPARQPRQQRQRTQMRAGRPPRVGAARLDVDAEPTRLRHHLRHRHALHRHRARRRPRQPHDHLHRRGLARAVRPEEARHRARPDRERQIVDHRTPPVPLRQSLDPDRRGDAHL